MRLLLASRSPARRRMLDFAGVPFEAVDAEIDEDDVKASLRTRGLTAAELALGLAKEKALSVRARAGDLVLGSDQTLELDDGAMLDKPGSREKLQAQLERLSGRTHQLHSVAAIAEEGEIVWTGTETVTMHVRQLGPDFLRDYIDREYDGVRWSVGGYHVEGRGVQLFQHIEGSHFAVQGLPLLPLLSILREKGVVAS